MDAEANEMGFEILSVTEASNESLRVLIGRSCFCEREQLRLIRISTIFVVTIVTLDNERWLPLFPLLHLFLLLIRVFPLCPQDMKIVKQRAAASVIEDFFTLVEKDGAELAVRGGHFFP